MAEYARFRPGSVKSNYETITGKQLIKAPEGITPEQAPKPPTGFEASMRQLDKNLPGLRDVPAAVGGFIKRGANQIVKTPISLVPRAINDVVASDTGQAIDASMRATYEDRPNTFGIDDRAASSITSQGGFMPGTPGAEVPMPTAQGAQPAIDDTMLRREPAPFTPSNPARGIGRVFTDAANAGRFTGPDGGPIVVSQDPETGENIYTQDGQTFDLQQAIQAEGPQPAYRGAPGEFQPFDRRSGLPGYQVSEAPVIAGEGAEARILEPGFRSRIAGGGAAAPGAAPATGLDATGQRDLNALQAGLPKVQAEYDAAVASGDQGRIDRARLSLLSQQADISRVRMGEGLSKPDIEARDAIEREMLKDLPKNPKTVGEALQKSRILAALEKKRAEEETRTTGRISAEASYRSAASGGETEAQRRQRNADAALKELEADATTGVDTGNLTRDPLTGAVTGGSMNAYGVTIDGADYTVFNRMLADRIGELTQLNPGVSQGEISRQAAREASILYARTKPLQQGQPQR